MSSGKLDHLQISFQDYLLGSSSRVIAQVVSTSVLSAARRLDIYHAAYRARLVEVLADTYERVNTYLGEAQFEAAAVEYIESNPPSSRNLRDYGRHFPAFLASHFPVDGEIAELAEMDGLLRNAFDAADAEPLRAEDLQSIDPAVWDGILFALHPTTSFQAFSWNTPALWQSLSDEAAPPAPEQLPQAMTWIFWRKALQPHFRSISPEEHAALQGIQAGKSFGVLCAELAQTYPHLDLATQVGYWLRTWLEEELLLRAYRHT